MVYWMVGWKSAIDRLPRPRMALIVCFMTASCLVAGLLLIQMRAEIRARALSVAQNLVSMASLDLQQMIGNDDQALLLAADRQDVAPSGPSGGITPGFGPIAVTDRDGRVRTRLAHDASPGVAKRDVSHADFFVAQRDRDIGLFIGRPRQDGPNRATVIVLSRRLSSSDGRFVGIVYGNLAVSSIQSVFDGRHPGREGAFTLFRADGARLAPVASSPPAIGSSLAISSLGGTASVDRIPAQLSGVIAMRSGVDSVGRIHRSALVGHLPLILDLELHQNDVFAGWYEESAVVCIVLIVCFLIALFLDARLHDSELQYRLLADHSGDVIMRLDHALVRSYVSPAGPAMLGYTSRELQMLDPGVIVHADDWPRVNRLLKAAQRTGQNVDLLYRVHHRDGHLLWLEGRYSHVPDDGGFVVALRDVTARTEAERRLKVANEQLAHLASHDALTGLANRRRFNELLSVECRRAAREQTPLSLLLLDVDRFKLFNDRYGHQAGDECLALVCAVLSVAEQRPADLLARYGGEELVFLLPVTDEAGAIQVGERVRSAVEGLALTHEGNHACGGVVTVSIGCATLYPQPRNAGAAGADLIADADKMLYEAKRRGRNRLASRATSSAADRLQVSASPRQSAASLQSMAASNPAIDASSPAGPADTPSSRSLPSALTV